MQKRCGIVGLFVLAVLFPAAISWSGVQSATAPSINNGELIELRGQVGGASYDVAVDGSLAALGVGTHLVTLDVSDHAHPVALGDTGRLPGEVRGVTLDGGYAYVAAGFGGLSVIDMSNPSAPVAVGRWDTPGEARGVTVAGNYAYVADGYYGLRVIDISNPAAPAPVGSCDTAGHARDVVVSGGYAYVADGYYTDAYDGTLRVIDVSNPAAPVEVGFVITHGHAQAVDVPPPGEYAYVVADYGLHVIDVSQPSAPAIVGWDQTGVTWLRDVTVSGGIAYVAEGWIGELRTFDVSDPTAPALLSTFDTPHPLQGIAQAGDLVYAAGDGGLRIIYVADPANPSHAGSYETLGSADDVAVDDGMAYVAAGYNGLRVVDVSNPADPIEVGSCPSPGLAAEVAAAGGYAYVGEIYGGLRIIDVSDPAAPVDVGFYNTPWFTTDVAVSGTYAYLTDGDGLHIIDVSDPYAPWEVALWDTHPAVSMTVVASRAYVGTLDGVSIVDVSNAALPVEMGFWSSDSAIEALAVQGPIIYAIEYQSVVHVIDASDPAAPVEIGFYGPGSSGGGADLAAVGGYLYIAEAGRGGLTILDISQPSAPRPVLYYGTLGSPSGLALDAGVGYVADGEGGLLVLGFDLPPTLQLNYRTGAPGSYLNLRGTDFGPSTTITLTVNATELGALQATARGFFTATLATDAADEGLYFARAIAGERVGAEFILDAVEPVRPRDGEWPLFDVPGGMALTEAYYLAVVVK